LPSYREQQAVIHPVGGRKIIAGKAGVDGIVFVPQFQHQLAQKPADPQTGIDILAVGIS
jgi:hypothetical protein